LLLFVLQGRTIASFTTLITTYHVKFGDMKLPQCVKIPTHLCCDITTACCSKRLPFYLIHKDIPQLNLHKAFLYNFLHSVKLSNKVSTQCQQMK
jgi:hypothetical protein